jgi:hypothetical protein
MTLNKLTDDFNMISESIRGQCHEFKATPPQKTIYITESSVASKLKKNQDVRPKQGTEFWQHFAEVTKFLGGHEGITCFTRLS